MTVRIQARYISAGDRLKLENDKIITITRTEYSASASSVRLCWNGGSIWVNLNTHVQFADDIDGHCPVCD